MKIFSKKQLKLREDVNNGTSNEKPELAVTNPDTDNDSTQYLDSAVSSVNQKNSIGANLRVDTSQFTNRDMTDSEKDSETILPNNSASLSRIKTDINTGKASGSYILQNGVERKGKLVEIATFNKRELNKFLRTI